MCLFANLIPMEIMYGDKQVSLEGKIFFGILQWMQLENIYLCASSLLFCDFDPGPRYLQSTSVTLQKMFHFKIKQRRGFLWRNNERQIRRFVQIHYTWPPGNVFTGYFRATVILIREPVRFLMDANGYEDVFISKLDNDEILCELYRWGL